MSSPGFTGTGAAATLRALNPMNKLVIPALICAVAPFAHAADTREQLAETLLEVSGTRRVSEEAMNNMTAMIMRQIGDTAKMPATMRPKMQRAIERITALMREEMGWEKLRPEMVRIYAATYTAEEMQAAITFYNSPAGKSFAAKTPAVSLKSTEIGMKRGVTLGPRIQRIMQEEMTKPDAPEAPASAPETPAPVALPR